MSGVATGYTLVLAQDDAGGGATCDYIVTDGGVLYATSDGGDTWRFYGLVDPEAFLLDLGFLEAWEFIDEDAARQPGLRRFLAA